jgi:hypothetical protein
MVRLEFNLMFGLWFIDFLVLINVACGWCHHFCFLLHACTPASPSAPFLQRRVVFFVAEVTYKSTQVSPYLPVTFIVAAFHLPKQLNAASTSKPWRQRLATPLSLRVWDSIEQLPAVRSSRLPTVWSSGSRVSYRARRRHHWSRRDLDHDQWLRRPCPSSR